MDPYNSHHICRISYELHDVKEKGFEYEGDLIQRGNLDRECLFIIFLDYLVNDYVERYSDEEFKDMINIFAAYLPVDFISAIRQLKTKGMEIMPFPYYIGDFFKDSEFKEKCNLLKGDWFYENNNFKGIK